MPVVLDTNPTRRKINAEARIRSPVGASTIINLHTGCGT